VSAWIWLDPAVIYAVHNEQLAEHGGSTGVRDAGLLESALARSQNLLAYGEPTVHDLAAAYGYGYGIARNHPFIDGNKRTAFVAVELFLSLNGVLLTATDVDCVITMLGLAAGELSEEAFAGWLRTNTAPR
jgi:death-on-curing protein